MNKKIIWGLSIIVVLGVVAGFMFSQRPVTASRKSFGTPIDTMRGMNVKITELFSQTDDYVGKNIILEGKVGMVCQSSGCWLFITDGTNQMMVQFYDFTVRIAPQTPIRVQGEVRLRNNTPYLAGQGLEVLK